MVKQKIKLSSRLAAFLLAVLMMASLFPAAAFADGPEDTPVPAGQTDSQPAVVEQDETTTPDDTTPQPGEPPAPEPAQQPTAEPTEEPTEEPTTEPTEEPTTEPTTEPTKEPTTEPTKEPEPEQETPAEVKAFLDAVAAIPAITPENAVTVSEYVYGEVSDLYEVLLGTEYEERPDVLEATAAYAAAIQAVDAALDIQSDNYWIPSNRQVHTVYVPATGLTEDQAELEFVMSYSDDPLPVGQPTVTNNSSSYATVL